MLFFFRVKHNYEGFRKDVSWFNGSHTAAVANVMSADDEMNIWEVSGFCVQSFATEKRRCNLAN